MSNARASLVVALLALALPAPLATPALEVQEPPLPMAEVDTLLPVTPAAGWSPVLYFPLDPQQAGC